MKRLLGAHVESSHTSTQVHGRYYSADACSAHTESKTISVDIDVDVVVVVVIVSINPCVTGTLSAGRQGPREHPVYQFVIGTPGV
jgi:hypothetical protein